MREVFLAEHDVLRRPCAVKVIRLVNGYMITIDPLGR
jgi:hypothetical protein